MTGRAEAETGRKRALKTGRADRENDRKERVL